MQDQGSWSACPSGVVTAMAGQLRRRERQARLRPRIAIGLVLLLISAVGYSLTNRNEHRSGVGLNCRETVPLLARYHAHSLDTAAANDVRAHLLHCPSCRKQYEELYSSEVRFRSPVENRLVAVAAQSSR